MPLSRKRSRKLISEHDCFLSANKNETIQVLKYNSMGVIGKNIISGKYKHKLNELEILSTVDGFTVNDIKPEFDNYFTALSAAPRNMESGNSTLYVRNNDEIHFVDIRRPIIYANINMSITAKENEESKPIPDNVIQNSLSEFFSKPVNDKTSSNNLFDKVKQPWIPIECVSNRTVNRSKYMCSSRTELSQHNIIHNNNILTVLNLPEMHMKMNDKWDNFTTENIPIKKVISIEQKMIESNDENNNGIRKKEAIDEICKNTPNKKQKDMDSEKIVENKANLLKIEMAKDVSPISEIDECDNYKVTITSDMNGDNVSEESSSDSRQMDVEESLPDNALAIKSDELMVTPVGTNTGNPFIELKIKEFLERESNRYIFPVNDLSNKFFLEDFSSFTEAQKSPWKQAEDSEIIEDLRRHFVTFIAYNCIEINLKWPEINEALPQQRLFFNVSNSEVYNDLKFLDKIVELLKQQSCFLISELTKSLNSDCNTRNLNRATKAQRSEKIKNYCICIKKKYYLKHTVDKD